ncbi:MAG TPA: hypothetical protein VE035_14225 [Puia sp.]|nr:hypothetical protein [Puia sp.]
MTIALQNLTLEKKLHYTLRIAVAMCFIGHGAFGIITKQVWCNYFAVFGIGQALAYKLMPLLGSFDILFGLILLAYPNRALPAWLVFWGIVTACLRPLSGEPFAEFIERAGNFGAPLAFLLLAGGAGNIKGWLRKVDPAQPANAKTLAQIAICLRIVVFLLLLGHGWLNFIGKKGLIGQYISLGFTHPGETAQAVGLFEMIAALVVLIRPIRSLLLGLFVWKMATELFYPHWEIFEWVERGGSYGSLLALWFVTGKIEETSFIRWPVFRRMA